MAGLENPLETNRDRRHLALESVSDHIRLDTPPFFIRFVGNPTTRIPLRSPTPPHHTNETGSRVELHQKHGLAVLVAIIWSRSLQKLETITDKQPTP